MLFVVVDQSDASVLSNVDGRGTDHTAEVPCSYRLGYFKINYIYDIYWLITLRSVGRIV